jgi:hypothetical protein
VGYLSFGLIDDDAITEMQRLKETLPAVSPIHARLLTTIAYQTEFGIFNHQHDHRRPLAPVAFHDKEDTLEGSQWFSHIRKYYHYRIGKVFNMSLDEFMSQPPVITNLLYDIAKSDATQHEKTATSVQKQMSLDLE